MLAEIDTLHANEQMYENLLNKIKDVLGSRIKLNREGAFEEIHIISNQARSPKQIVRDVETVMLVNCGITLDHKIVSVVQIPENSLEQGAANNRLCLNKITTSITKEFFEVTVQLSLKDRLFAGKVQAVNSPSRRLRTIAEATLQALMEYLDSDKIQSSIDEITQVKLGENNLILVSVYLASGGVGETLIGTSLIKNNDQEAVCKAVLSAINRKITCFSSTR